MQCKHMESSALVWESLVRKEVELARTEDLASLASRLGKHPRHTIDHLVRMERIIPLLKGTYYVRRPDEVSLGTRRRNHLELFALAATVRPVGTWYFALETALRYHGMTHEHWTHEVVISDRLHRPRGVDVAGTRFLVHKWLHSITNFGVEKKGLLRISDREKTVADLAYRDFWRARKGLAPTHDWRAYIGGVEPVRLNSYITRFPADFAEWVKPWI